MKNLPPLSLGMTGAFIAVAGTLLVGLGFSETCANEITMLAPGIAGGALAWFGRYRLGDVSWYGTRKPGYEG